MRVANPRKLPDHPITITPNPKEVRIELDGEVIARSKRALSRRGASYPIVHQRVHRQRRRYRGERSVQASNDPHVALRLPPVRRTESVLAGNGVLAALSRLQTPPDAS